MSSNFNLRSPRECAALRGFVAVLAVILSGCGLSSKDGASFNSPIQGGVAGISGGSQNMTGGAEVALPAIVNLGPQTPNDPLFSEMWHLNNTGQACPVTLNGMSGTLQGKAGAHISATAGWGIATDCSSILIAINDSGVDTTHPDLQGEIDPRGMNFVVSPPSGDIMDDEMHGTHVAGIIGALGGNSAGVSGICWKAKLLPLKIADSTGAISYTSDIINAMDYSRTLGAKISNNSWGLSPVDPADPAFQADMAQLSAAISRMQSSNMLFVTVAGNGDANGQGLNDDSNTIYPAAFNLPNMITVASTDQFDQLSSFSNFGNATVQIAAPGWLILSTLPQVMTAEMSTEKLPVKYGNLSGTSMAAPMVSAVAALVWSQNPAQGYDMVRRRVLAGADVLSSLSGKVQGGRRLNLKGALLAK
jgi:subtilisin family serine protease